MRTTGLTTLLALVAALGCAGDPTAPRPDASAIVFSSSRSGNDEVYVMDLDGANPVNLTLAPASFESGPAVSPDGTKIAFRSSRDGNLEIYVMDADGSGAVNLTNNAATDGSPSWVPLP